MITKELKVAATICGFFLGRIIWKNFKKDVNENYEKNVDMAITKEIGDSVIALEEGVASMKEDVVKIADRENAEIDSRLNEFKESVHYDEKISAYKKQITDGVEEYKTKINAGGRINAAKIALGKEIEQYKKDNSYDRKVNSFKKAIKEAETEYEGKISRYKVFADREEMETLKEKAKIKRDEIVSMNKIELEALEKEFKDFSKEATERANVEINAVNALVAKEEGRLKAEIDPKINDIKSLVKKTNDNIVADVKSKRTQEETDAINRYYSNKDTLEECKKEVRKARKNMIENSTFKDRVCLYLHSKNFKRWHVEAIGMAPVAVVGYGLVKYLAWLKDFAIRVEKGNLI